MTYRVLFVCAGNVGRSPLAEVVARRLLSQALGVTDEELESTGIDVRSAGTLAPPGVPASLRSAAVAEEIGITMGPHPSQRLEEGIVARSDVIYCMDGTQLDFLARLDWGDKAELLDLDGEAIPDPRGQDLDFYRQVRDRIRVALERRLPRILADAGLA